MNEDHESDRNDCDHEWKAVEETCNRTHIKLVCVQCGKTKEIELFP